MRPTRKGSRGSRGDSEQSSRPRSYAADSDTSQLSRFYGAGFTTGTVLTAAATFNLDGKDNLSSLDSSPSLAAVSPGFSPHVRPLGAGGIHPSGLPRAPPSSTSISTAAAGGTVNGAAGRPSPGMSGLGLSLKMARSVASAPPSDLLFRTPKGPRTPAAPGAAPGSGAGSGAGASPLVSAAVPGGSEGLAAWATSPRAPAMASVERCWSFWKQQLRSCSVFTLLTDYARPVPTAPASGSGATAASASAGAGAGVGENTPIWTPDPAAVSAARSVRAELTGAAVDQVRGAAFQHHATLFEAFLAVFQVLLFRYSRETDVTVLADTGVNVVPLRTAVAGDLSFRQLLRLVKITVEQAFHHDALGAAALGEAMQSPQLSTVGFHLLHEDEAPGPEEALFARAHELALGVDLHEEGFAVVTLHYDSRIFAPETAEQLLAHYTHLCGALADPAHANSTVAVVPLAPAEETEALLRLRWPEVSGGPVVDHWPMGYEWDCDRHLTDLFEAQAAKTPNAPCIDDEGVVLTYAEVNARANAIARLLLSDASLGIAPGSDHIVSTLLPRCGDVYVCQLAIMKAGCAYICIDCTYPQDRVDYILKDSRTRILITTAAFSGKQGEAPELLMDSPEVAAKLTAAQARKDNTDAGIASARAAAKMARKAVIEAESKDDSAKTGATPPSERARGEDLCYVIYTSGTTGVPKGVMIEHRCAVNFVLAESVAFQVKASDRVLQGFSTSFDASVEEIWLAFFAGACLVVGSLATMQSGPSLPQALFDLKVTVVSTVPTLLTMISPPAPDAPADDVDTLPLVRLLILGGEACPPELVARWAPGRTLINSFGPTEATVVTSYEKSVPGKRVTIGKPLPNYYCTVVDANNNPCPVGMPGELLIGGISLARGYLNLPDKTAEKFGPTPFPSIAGDVPMLYQTGDLCRFLRNGDIEFLGRIDSQVKLRGFRVELSEIESVIAQLPSVRSAVVAVRGQNLIAYIVPKDTAAGAASPGGAGDEASAAAAKHGSVFVEDANSLLLPDTDPLARSFDAAGAREFMKKMLPHYMLPGQLVLVSDIPSLPSGKADRKTLLQIKTTESAGAGTGGAGAGRKRETRKKKASRAHLSSLSSPTALEETRYFRHATDEKRAALAAALAKIEAEFGPNPSRATAITGGNAEESSSDVSDCSDDEGDDDSGLTPLEKEFLALWEEVLGQAPISPDADFFTDLGGHSVVAALVVSGLRKRGYTASMRDLYGGPTVRLFTAKILEDEGNKAKAGPAAFLVPPPADAAGISLDVGADNASTTDSLAYQGPLIGACQEYLVWLFQSLALLCAVGWLAMLRVGLYYVARWAYDANLVTLSPLSLSLMALLTAPLLTAVGLLSTLALVPFKWLLLGRVRPGKYPLYGWFHMRWWLASKVTIAFPFVYFRNTWVSRWLMRVLGAKIGHNVYLGSFLITDYDLITIGDNASINTQARLSPHRFEGGYLILEPIVIGRGAVIGPRAAVSGGVTVAEDAELEALSLLPAGAETMPETLYRGSPATAVGPATATPTPTHSAGGSDGAGKAETVGEDGVASYSFLPHEAPFAASAASFALLSDDSDSPYAPAPRHRFFGTLVSLAMFFSMSLYGLFTGLMYGPAALGFYLYLGPPKIPLMDLLPWAAPVVVGAVLLNLVLILVLRWVVCWRFHEGVYTTDSWVYFRKWFVDMLTDISLMSTQTLFATVYTPFFLRLMGVRMGARVECSTLFDYTPCLTVLEDECFIADHVATGSIVVRRNVFELKTTRVGARTFVGNNAVLVTGSTLAEGCLLGVSSTPPPGGAEAMGNGTSWVGCPSFKLPARKVVDVDEGDTFSPPWYKVAHRAWWEIWKIFVPTLLSTANYIFLVLAAQWAVDEYGGPIGSFVFFPVFSLCMCVGLGVLVVLLKWLLIGKFRQVNYALWSVEVWRAEFLQGLEENLIAPLFLSFAQGTWWAVLWYRLNGANIGERVYLDTIYLTEPDLITIDDDAVIESSTTVQTHLFEDRVMKMEPLHIGRGCAVGSNSVVLYSSRMEDGSVLEQSSLLMKGETLMAGRRYAGIPAVAHARPVKTNMGQHMSPADYQPPVVSSLLN